MGLCLLCSQEESVWTPPSGHIHNLVSGSFLKALTSRVLTSLLMFLEAEVMEEFFFVILDAWGKCWFSLWSPLFSVIMLCISYIMLPACSLAKLFTTVASRCRYTTSHKLVSSIWRQHKPADQHVLTHPINIMPAVTTQNHLKIDWISTYSNRLAAVR